MNNLSISPNVSFAGRYTKVNYGIGRACKNLGARLQKHPEASARIDRYTSLAAESCDNGLTNIVLKFIKGNSERSDNIMQGTLSTIRDELVYNCREVTKEISRALDEIKRFCN